MKTYNLFIILVVVFSSRNIFASHFPNYENKTIHVILNKCKTLPHKKILEISSYNSQILKVEKDFITNKICLKGNKVGSTKLSMLLLGSSGEDTWHVQVISPLAKKKGKSKRLKPSSKISNFDKELGNPYSMPGWQ
ncbi:hypothetical protein [Silvanigrella aquatica]|uniref:Pilus formation protein N-terminal domain-containing protein n=1 Tax=Silvanigrella aquatica TaxID=1915309 RepID=A0A1L4CX42_9BACT|nr:hypothetical protein [Silvanigrella aquatica]APJ02506.1 hypothetical protein AXG55_00580 [Silvanigrella aquatica]